MSTELRVKIFGCVAVAAMLLLGACSPITATHGNLVDDERLERIEVGRSDTGDVINALGSPTVISTFDENTWYYVGRATERLAFFKPRVAEQRIVEVRFDENGTLTAIEDVDPELRRDINPVGRETPTGGRQLSFFEQIFGNLGGL